MKITKSIKLLVLAGVIIIGVLMTGCMGMFGVFIPEGFEVVEKLDDTTYEIRNEETGVHYYFSSEFMTPVYQFNGQVKVTEDKDLLNK